MIVTLKKIVNEYSNQYNWYEADERIGNKSQPIPVTGQDVPTMKNRIRALYPNENIIFEIEEKPK